MTFARASAAGIIALGTTAIAAFPAAANPSDDVLRSLSIEAVLAADGSIRVTETLEWDFSSRDGLGLFRSIEQWMAWEHDDDMMRVMEVSDYEVSSPSGAPAEVWVEEDGQFLQLAIGAPDGSDDTRSGMQTYVLSYTIDGLVNPIRDEPDVPDQDELYWNVTGHDWEVRIDQVDVTVTGPAPVEDLLCWEGPFGSTTSCESSGANANTAEFSAADLAPGEGLTISVAFPEGSVPGAEIMLEPDETSTPGGPGVSGMIARVTDPLVRYWPGLVVLAVGAIVADLVRRRRTGRDLHFVGLPPGSFPPAQEAETFPVAPLTREPTATVAFTPPPGLSPAELGFLVDRKPVPQHLSATVVDLAVRGFLRISEAAHSRRGEPQDWSLQLASNARERSGELREHEQQLLRALFATGPEVRLKALKNSFASHARAFGKASRRGVMRRGLFARVRPEQPDVTPRSGITLPTVVMLVAGIVATSEGFGALPPSAVRLAALVTGAALLWAFLRQSTVTWTKPRSAAGRALYEQSRGFQLYIATAEAEQIRFEEGIDVFSRYLPYAMIYGEAERWSGIFDQLQAEGRYRANTAWYVGSHHTGNQPGLGQLGRSLSGFNTAAGRSLTSTPGGSGGSGFSGGSSGGGAGGGGGGGR